MNISLLENKEYVDSINAKIEHSLELNKYKTPSDKWQILKSEITELMQYYSKKIASERRK